MIFKIDLVFHSMKFGNWKRLKEMAQKAAAIAGRAAKIGGKIINYARPAIDAAADFIPGGSIIKKGAEMISKVAEPIGMGLEQISKGANVIKTIKSGVGDYAKRENTDTAKRLNNFVQNNIPDNPFGSAVNEDDDDFIE